MNRGRWGEQNGRWNLLVPAGKRPVNERATHSVGVAGRRCLGKVNNVESKIQVVHGNLVKARVEWKTVERNVVNVFGCGR